MNVRWFEINVSCSSCANKIDKVLKNYLDIKYTLNVLERMISITADEDKYSDEFVIKLFSSIGYKVERI